MALTALLKSSGSTLLTTLAVTALGFASSVLTARLLGPEGRGLLSAALLITMLAGNAALCGLANSYIYHRGAGRAFDYRRLFGGSLLFVTGLAVLLALLGLQLAGHDALQSQLPLILLLAGATASQGYFYALSQLHERLRFFNALRLALVLGNLLLLLLLLVALPQLQFQHILAAQLVVAAALTGAGLLWARRHTIWRPVASIRPPARWGELLGYGLNHHGTVLLGLLLVNVDKIALLKLASIVEFGFYALAFTTSRLIGAVQEAVSTALYSRFAGKDVEELSRHVRGAFRVTFLPMLLLAALGAALAPWLIVWVYGEAFAAMALPFAILLFECVISGASWTLAQRFNAGGRPGLVFARQCVSVLPLLLALPFLPAQHIHVWLSLLMLLGALLRLGVTLGLYPCVLKERMPRLLPTPADCAAAYRLITRRSYG